MFASIEPAAVVTFFIVVGGYLLMSYLLQRLYYDEDQTSEYRLQKPRSSSKQASPPAQRRIVTRSRGRGSSTSPASAEHSEATRGLPLKGHTHSPIRTTTVPTKKTTPLNNGEQQLLTNHYLLCGINIFNMGLFGAATMQAIVTGRTRMEFTTPLAGGGGGGGGSGGSGDAAALAAFVAAQAAWTVAALVWQTALEYYHHRIQHLPFMYRRTHKLHHACT
jgi:hypothetical protein